MKKVFVCSPYRGDIEKNKKQAALAARILAEYGYMPIVPHLYFPQFFNENDERERIRGIELGCELLKECEKIWIIGTEITSGMEFEIEAAKEYLIPAEMYDEDFRIIKARTIHIDGRIDDRTRGILKGLKLK